MVEDVFHRNLENKWPIGGMSVNYALWVLDAEMIDE